jgi:hypothetical protein
MNIRRILIPTMVALGVAGSILASAAAPAALAQGNAVHAQAAAVRVVPNTWYQS